MMNNGWFFLLYYLAVFASVVLLSLKREHFTLLAKPYIEKLCKQMSGWASAFFVFRHLIGDAAASPLPVRFYVFRFVVIGLSSAQSLRTDQGLP